MEDLQISLTQYNEQLDMVKQALETTQNGNDRESLITLQSELQELINLTQEGLEAHAASSGQEEPGKSNTGKTTENGLDDEYALFMQEMAKSGAYDGDNKDDSQDSKDVNQNEDSNDSDIDDELSSLLGMKCAVYHTHKWGGQPTLHNAMVSSVVPRQEDDQFSDLQVQILYTHPTHAEMLPCPFYLDGECKFTDEQCRYSHGTTVQLSTLKEAIEPDYESLKVGSRVLLKLKPPENEDISIAKKSTEKYYLWHRAIVRHIDLENRSCLVNLEHGARSGEKRKSLTDVHHVQLEEIFPLSTKDDADSSSGDELSDTEYPQYKTSRTDEDGQRDLLIEKSLQTNSPAMGEWEKHTRGIGSKLMLAMGYVPGTGLGATGEGRVQPVEARNTERARSLDQCMAISEKLATQDPLKVQKKLKRLQKKEEERNKRAYEREKNREKQNVFNFLNKTIGSKSDKEVKSASGASVDLKQSSSKDLNIEQFKAAEEGKRLEAEIIKLNSSLAKYPQGTNGHRSISQQVSEKSQELSVLRSKEQQIAKEQKQRKDKQKMTVF